MINYIEKLEFNIILNSIREYCTFFLSKNMALDIIPSSDLDEINSLQIETNEARKFLEQDEKFSFSSIKDSKIFSLALPKNEIIKIDDIYQLSKFLKECNYLKRLLKPKKQISIISKYSEKIVELNDLIGLIDLSIDDNVEIKSSASPALKKLRKKSFIS